MSRVPGLLTFNPVPVPPLPEPWQSATTEQKLAFAQTMAAFGDFDQLQQTRNMLAVQAGNLLAKHAVDSYNGLVKRYWLNGGPNNTYGFTLPVALPQLAQYYKPAEDATEIYDPATRSWKPSGLVIDTPIWSLPADTVLFTVEA